MPGDSPLRIPVFPLAGALLFPRAQLPLHIFEPRGAGEPPPLFEVGCIGRIAGAEELEDGRFNIVLEGLGRFRVTREAEVDTLYRQVDAESGGFDDSAEPEPLGLAQRAELEREARRYADALGYSVDWDAVTRLDDEMLVNAIAQVAPLDVGSKQALLEAPDIAERCDLLVQFMQFQRMVPGGAEGPETLQ